MMRQKLYLFVLIVFSSQNVFSQDLSSDKKTSRQKGTFYFTWGYNKDWFSKSDIHFKNSGKDPYDFTLHKVSAEDRPNFDELFNKDISIPQFIYRFGYYFKNGKLGIEGSFDHAKYIMIQDQVVRISGSIHDVYLDKDTSLSRNFIQFEHTNGANFIMLSLMWRDQLLVSRNGKHVLQGVVKPGAGIVVPQSDVSIMGVRQNNKYHVAGYIVGAEANLRYEPGKHFFIETGFKGVWANYVDVLAVDEAKANHSFFALEWIIGIGYRIAL
ncbi:MAG: hypothetical protein EYC69_04565 [Bacteroidetes bacterium]|nr:MAG: hypothetical protein EYC69_04565 [Bacteroidota bacterium]